MPLTLLLGGVRSGKSARALQLAETHRGGGRVLFVATAEALDEEMRRRIDIHRTERPASWDTLEVPLELSAGIRDALTQGAPSHSVVVIDCVTVWVSNILCALGEDDDAEAIIGDRTRELIDTQRQCAPQWQRWIIITNEVGLGVVPPTSLGRRYRDALGRANQLIAAAADTVSLMVAGIEVSIKR